MDRRHFLHTGTAAALAAGLGCAKPLIAATDADKPFEINMPENEAGLHARFIGTGAADWNGPDARGEHRRLTSILFERNVLIDFTPTDKDMIPDGCHPEVIFYTHSHGDHYNPGAAIDLGVKRVYLGATWIDVARKQFADAAGKAAKPAPEVIPLEIGQSVTESGITLTALPANHGTTTPGEQTLIYLVEKGAVRLLYATDTGGIPAIAARIAGIDKHYKDGIGITALIMEATMGMDHDEDFRIYTHSSVGTVLRTAHVLQKTGRYRPAPGQPVFLTHMARTLHGTQAELDANLPSPLRAAHDGLEVCFTAGS